MSRSMDDLRRRFFSRILPAPSGCWEWLGHRNEKGYGMLASNWTQPRNYKAHRFSYEQHVGPIPEGLQIDHLCRNRGCVNPGHLQAVTPQQNQLRGLTVSSRLAGRTHCAYGHPLDGVRTKGRKRVRYCRTCHNDRIRERKARRRDAERLARAIRLDSTWR